jgi:hypothetical protein
MFGRSPTKERLMPACRRYIAIAVAVPLAAASSLAVAACGGSSPPASTASADASALKFAQCMRQHGIAFPDPSASGQQAIQVKDPRAFDAANAACARYRVAGGKNKPTPAQQAEFQDKALQFSRCMRAHGVNMPDPQTSANGGAIKITKRAGSGDQGPDPSSPVFQNAQKACQSLMPKGAKNQTFRASGPPGGGAGGSVVISGGNGG